MRRTLLPLILVLTVGSLARAEEPTFVGWYLKQLEQSSSTTSLRREDKAIVPAKHADRFLAELQGRFGPLTPRDVAPAGKVNMTSTDYLNTGKRLPELLGLSSIPAGSISPKIRIRTYQTRPVEGGKLTAAPITDGISLLEIKMPHPTKPGVSLKPRLFINDRHLRLLLRRKSFNDPATRQTVLQTLKADTRNDPQVVDRMVAVLGGLHQQHKGKRLRPWVQTRYQREAYLIPIPSGGDVQITMDRDVSYRHPRKDKVVKRMSSKWRAVEVKIPEVYATMTDHQLRQGGLGMVAEIRQLQRSVLGAHQVKGLGVGKGKCSAFSRLAPHKASGLRHKEHWR